MYPRKDKPIEWLLLQPHIRNISGSILGLDACGFFFPQSVQVRPTFPQLSIIVFHKTLQHVFNDKKTGTCIFINYKLITKEPFFNRNLPISSIIIIIISSTELGGLCPPLRGFQITFNDGSQSVGLLWTSGQLVAETTHNTHNRQTSMPLLSLQIRTSAGAWMSVC